MAFTLPDLPYAHDALAPVMSRETLEFHHDKHHQAYVTKGNELIQGTGMEDKPLEEVVRAAFKDPALTGLFNNAGQHWNHVQFWQWMKPSGGGKIPGELEARIVQDFGSVEQLRQAFVQAGVGQFGSGWCWIEVKPDGKLAVSKTPNGESPLAHGSGHAILGCDVWEHSYYIDYRNARQKYLEAFFDSLVNWERVAELHAQAGR